MLGKINRPSPRHDTQPKPGEFTQCRIDSLDPQHLDSHTHPHTHTHTHALVVPCSPCGLAGTNFSLGYLKEDFDCSRHDQVNRECVKTYCCFFYPRQNGKLVKWWVGLMRQGTSEVVGGWALGDRAPYKMIEQHLLLRNCRPSTC